MRGEIPTIRIRTSVFVERHTSQWVWVPAGADYPDAHEYLFTSSELSRALFVYGAAVARLMTPQDVPGGFRLTAHTAGRTVGEHEWRVSTETGLFIPCGLPWVLLDEYLLMFA